MLVGMVMPSQKVQAACHIKLLKLKKEFTNKCLVDDSQDPKDWITELESLHIQMG